jgi:hypothetical protein
MITAPLAERQNPAYSVTVLFCRHLPDYPSIDIPALCLIKEKYLNQ